MPSMDVLFLASRPLSCHLAPRTRGRQQRLPTLDGVAALNLAVTEAKTALMNFRSYNRLSKLHIFIKAP